MKNLFVITVFLWLCSISTYSQWGGVNGGVGASSLTNSKSYAKAMTAFHIGGLYDLKLSDKWYLQPEFQFVKIGFNLKDDGILSKGGHVKIYAIELPVNISFRPKVASDAKLLLDFGLYVRYGLFGNKTYEYYLIDKIDESPFDAYNRLGTGLNMGVGFQKKQYYWLLSLQRELSYFQKNLNSYNQIPQFSIGYKF